VAVAVEMAVDTAVPGAAVAAANAAVAVAAVAGHADRQPVPSQTDDRPVPLDG
jgi:hypothetical protein